MSAAELILATGNMPPAPANGRVTLFAATDNQLYWRDAAGNTNKVGRDDGALLITTGKTLTVQNALTLAGTDGKSLTLTRSLIVAGQDGMLIFGGTGSDAFTIPSGGGTAVVLGGEQTITGRKILNTATDSERLVVQTTNMTTKQAIKVMTSPATPKALHVTRAAALDTAYICEFSLQDLGVMEWGPGDATARDVRLRRSGSSTLTIDTPSGGSGHLRITGLLGVNTAVPQAGLHVTKTPMANASNAGYDTHNSAFTLESTDPVMQLIGDDAGQAGQGIIMSSIAAAGGTGNKHWLLHAAGPSRSNRFELRYGTSGDGITGNLFGNLISGTLSLCVVSTGEVGIGTTAPAHKLDVSGTCRANTFHVGTNQVVGARAPGWAAATGVATRTAFNTSTVTLTQLAERVKALLDDLIQHGLLGA